MRIEAKNSSNLRSGLLGNVLNIILITVRGRKLLSGQKKESHVTLQIWLHASVSDDRALQSPEGNNNPYPQLLQHPPCVLNGILWYSSEEPLQYKMVLV